MGTLENGQIIAGIGSIQRPNWVPESQQSAAYTVNFPVSRLGWREAAVRFTPSGSGTVTLTLMGPWEEASAGVVYRQEVLWDAFEVDGAVLVNGSFEITGLRLDEWRGKDRPADQRRSGCGRNALRTDLA